ncbi:hypothetical protein SAMN05421493_10231 [Pseudobutyrivibrio sp. 49]|uniref:hypothetical protein n=1 Tax=Pseudobutyrivibrio sp. 49 TaxID=1855344 RepID=UPI0008901547|nr:hypothetical protein [Pseudobutyrivibrio sp. 49]SDH57726.1 hypothetical protein SAMN05421493_10231 [Pseudobutyrivibrio sp. 49]
MKSRNWLIGLLLAVVLLLGGVASVIIYVDPYFHYHGPQANLYYELNNERSQNDGIIRHFKYDGMIIGTSMAENFKTSEAEELWGGTFIKVPFAGGTFKEQNDNIAKAIKCNPDLKVVIRTLDYAYFMDDADKVRDDLGDYPEYLYDNNPFNDVNYIFNKDIFYKICLPMLDDARHGKAAGITSFDDYANWMEGKEFGPDAALLGRTEYKAPEKVQPFVDEVKEMVKANITQNVTDLAKANPDIDFYYYVTPYSVAWWGSQKELGVMDRWFAVEQYAIELMLECDNIHLYSFNNEFDVTSNLDNYNDECHHGDWINSQILGWLYSGTDQLTKENYKDYLAIECDFYRNFDYEGLL